MSELFNVETFAAISVFLVIALIGVIIVSLKQVNVAFDSGYDSGKCAGQQGLISAESIGFKAGYEKAKKELQQTFPVKTGLLVSTKTPQKSHAKKPAKKPVVPPIPAMFRYPKPAKKAVKGK